MLSKKIRVGIADDHSIVRSGLRDYINAQPDMLVVGEAGNGKDAIDLLRQTPMDVLILDVEMPARSGIDAIAQLRAMAPQVQLLILTGYSAEVYAVKLLKLGAGAYLNKQCEPQEIVSAIKVLATGKRYLQPEVATLLAEWGPNRLPHENLSAKEFQIFLKLARGGRPGQVGAAVSVSPKTVSSYRVHIMKKIGVHTNSELTAYALKHKLID